MHACKCVLLGACWVLALMYAYHKYYPSLVFKVKESVCVPVVANGDIFSLSDVEKVCQVTGVDGVMSARGMLENPAMYAGFECTPLQCVQDWVSEVWLWKCVRAHVLWVGCA